jgi:hypothetical protein
MRQLLSHTPRFLHLCPSAALRARCFACVAWTPQGSNTAITALNSIHVGINHSQAYVFNEFERILLFMLVAWLWLVECT